MIGFPGDKFINIQPESLQSERGTDPSRPVVKPEKNMIQVYPFQAKAPWGRLPGLRRLRSGRIGKSSDQEIIIKHGIGRFAAEVQRHIFKGDAADIDPFEQQLPESYSDLHTSGCK